MMADAKERASWVEFVQGFFRCIGGRIEKRDGGLRVELTREQLQLVEGRPPSLFGWDWNPGGSTADELTVLYLTFTADGSGTEAELCVPGSFRGRQIIDAALRLWPLGRTFLPAAESTTSPADAKSWRPYFVFHFRLRYVADDVSHDVKVVAVDLISGDVVGTADIAGRASAPTPVHNGISTPANNDAIPSQSPRLTVGDAYKTAAEYVYSRLQAADNDWAVAGHKRVQAELEGLRAFVRRAEIEENPESLAPLRAARLAEWRRLRPRVDVELAAATVVYAPEAG